MKTASSTRLLTGVEGLDEILEGGFIPCRAYLVRGGPGCGKTTLGLHFLTAGIQQGEQVLFITLGEPEAQVRQNAQSIGFDLKGVNFLDLSPRPEFFAKIETYDIFSPAEVERVPTTEMIIQSVEKLKPQRVFVDAMTQFRYLATDPFQFHKQVLSFLRFLIEQGATVLFTSESSVQTPDDDLQFISDGVINLTFDPGGRTISVSKFRGSSHRSGCHAMKLTERGIEVFPIIIPEKYIQEYKAGKLSSGVPELDELLSGGLDRGTSTLIIGPAGVGKTSLGLQFMKEAAGRGERSVVYTLGEMVATIIHRGESINIPVRSMIERGTLEVVRVEPLRFSADEFAHMLRHEVEKCETKIVMIDSLAGYRLLLMGQDLVAHLHALGKYLVNMGVTLIIIYEMKNITGEFQISETEISYLADNILFLRYLEIESELRRSIGVLKMRCSDFEKTLREFEITRYGIKVGKPLIGLRGILSGIPHWAKLPGGGNVPAP